MIRPFTTAFTLAHIRLTAVGYNPVGLLVLLSMAALAILAGCSINPTPLEQLQRDMALPVDHFRKTMTVKDDAFDRIAILTTKRGAHVKRLIGQKNWSDQFLRGFIDKKTGKHRYQVYVSMVHEGWHWRQPYRANFGSPLASAETERIFRDKNCYGKKNVPCLRLEEVGFALPVEELNRVALGARAADLTRKVWQFKIKMKNGEDYIGAMPLAEMIAF